MAGQDQQTRTSTLHATYTSPTTQKTFVHPLPPSASIKSTEEKTIYLSALRKSVVRLQEEVNGYLTTKMDEDKASAADEKAEDENYGEEKVEEGD